MPSLRREEARERAALLSVHSVRVELDLRDARTADTFTSTTTLHFSTGTGGATWRTFVDVSCVRLHRAVLNGVQLDADVVDGRLALDGDQLNNELVVEAEMAYSSDGEGLHRHVDPADGETYLYAMSFLDAAPRWFACFDQPDLKAPVTLLVHAPGTWRVLGNGPAVELAPGLVEIRQPRPLASYFVTLVAGPWASVLDEHDGIPLGVHAKASLAEALRREAPDVLAVTRASFDAYHRLFGLRYPFGEYHQAFVPDFNAGAMENPGCVTLRDQMVFTGAAGEFERCGRASTIAHEMAHMWFGDLVTMRWWDDLWLNESFAEYMAQRVCSEATGYDAWSDFGIVRKAWGSVADQAPSTHPVAGNGSATAAEALSQFDGISYAKGAAVLGQLAVHLGDRVFLAGLRDHFARHAYGNAELADLMAAWTRAGAVDLEGWQRAWLQTSGMDRLEVARDDEGWRLTRVAPEGGSGRSHAVQVAAFGADGRELAREAVTVAASPVRLGLPAGSLVVPDADDATWARVRLADGWSGLDALASLESTPARIVVWNSVRDGVLSAELDPAAALTLLEEQLPAEPSDVVVKTVLGAAAGTWAGPYTAAADRPAVAARLAALAETLLTGAEPGGDRQLVAWRTLIDTTTDQDRLTGWWEGTGLPPGRELDEDLTWRIAVRMSVLGRDQVVEPTLERHPTAVGRAQAARCRASLPTAAAKEWALQVVLQPSELSAYEVYAVADGLFLPEQHELTAPLVPRWLDGVAATSGFRSGWSLSTVVTRSFPAAHVDPGTLEQVDAVLARDDLDPAVRRPLVDCGDALRRALTSVQRFGRA
ncbi:aminopeptidase N [Auraticoccus sp. F435]|uniref:Aminopeptidase N n=1 Tax=Auraticoccus cholistanensis TaxID=2656650 RepID=A0A6A9UTG7_9ACTN|nr:aminopeptidase N [Auraticoccus cholistanensis]MVA76226.1 aminopeptidase N [Auraticoccus cholistanensis]